LVDAALQRCDAYHIRVPASWLWTATSQS